jgi:hypothetical protein
MIRYVLFTCALPVFAAESAGEPPLRRLTHSQYNHTVLDLLGDPSNPANQFPPDDFVHGFKTQYEAQGIPPLLAEAYSAAAERLAAAYRLPTGHSASDFVRDFGRRAFRRSLTDKEVERYTAMFSRGSSPTEGARLVVESMLQSPSFLFRSDADAASRIAFFLWDSAPDNALLEAAERGEMSTPDGLERAARRALDNPKARRSVDEFISQWLRFDRVWTSVKERRSYPSFTVELTRSMTEETRRLANHLVWNRQNFMDLFRAQYTFATADLAAIYGLPAPEDDFARLELPPASERSGVLTHASFLSLTSKPAETSPTARGLFIREQFLCQTVPPPPPGVNSNLPPQDETRPMTSRERLAAHTTNPSCAGCHQLIDPIGFAFEKFDAIGGRREKVKVVFMPGRREEDKKPRSVELDLDTSGRLAGLRNSPFSNPRELGELLAENPLCQECVVKQIFRFASGRLETAADRPAIRQALADFRRSGFQFQELMVSVLKYSAFPPERN